LSFEVDIRCVPDGRGWDCHVTVTEDGSQTTHEVRVPAADLARLAPGAADPHELVARSFRFLLAREPKESILARFDLGVISRYFPEFDPEIGRG
jgi:hypothetical protein